MLRAVLSGAAMHLQASSSSFQAHHSSSWSFSRRALQTCECGRPLHRLSLVCASTRLRALHFLTCDACCHAMPRARTVCSYMGGVLVHTLMAGASFGEAALLPVPPREQLPPRLAQLWEHTPTMSGRAWPCLFAVRALSNCSLLVLSAEGFGGLAQEYEWVSAHAAARRPGL